MGITLVRGYCVLLQQFEPHARIVPPFFFPFTTVAVAGVVVISMPLSICTLQRSLASDGFAVLYPLRHWHHIDAYHCGSTLPHRVPDFHNATIAH